MDSVNMHSIPIICQLYDLGIVTAHSDKSYSDTILHHDKPFSVQVSLAFMGTNAIALLALEPVIQITFYVKPLQAGPTIDIGVVTTKTDPHQMEYTPELHLGAPIESGLTAATVYQLGVLTKIGALNQPALLCGVLEDLMVQIYNSQDTD